MKSHKFVALLLSLAVVLPALAQQTNSTPSTQSATTGQTASSSQSATARTKDSQRDKSVDFWEGDEPSAAALIFHPFASKGWVQRHVGPIRERLNELEELNASNDKMTKDVDAGAQHGIQLASEKTKEADQHAMEASSKSQTARQSATAVSSRVSKVETAVGSFDQYKPAGAQTVIHFRPGQSVLSKDAKQALDEMAAKLKGQRGYVVEVHGFSSGSGQAAIASSRKMADSVVRYLVLNHEIPAYRIYVVGMGNAPVSGAEGTTDKHPGRSRVEISVLKNNLELASTSASDASTPAK
jgi:outer membrane protein OmpA-like peptidoglycan-associated protein